MSYEDSAKAFGAGADARIAGEPASANPYTRRYHELGRQWREGWDHADREWGKDRPWCRPLPEVREKP